MQYRVQNIKDQFTKLNIAYDEMKKEILFTQIKSIFHPTSLETPIEEVPASLTSIVSDIQPRKTIQAEEINEDAHTTKEILKSQIPEVDDYDIEKRIKEIEYALKGKTLPDEKKQHKKQYKEGSIEKFLQDNNFFTIKVVSDTEYIVGAHNSPMNGIAKYIDNEWTILKWL
jgi:hypothetical protein